MPSITYLTYGEQSGVSSHVARALGARGHDVRVREVTGPLEWRRDGRIRLTPATVRHLAESARRHGARALAHRWNTPYAFDLHSRRAGELVEASGAGVVLQNGALFAPGTPPLRPYVLLLDHTRALSMDLSPLGEAGRGPAVDYGPAWRARETAAYRGARAVATFSERVAASLVRDYGVERARVRVVGAGATLEARERPRAHDGRTIAFVGRDFDRKGGRVLVRAFERLRRGVPGARLVVAGPREPLALPAGAVQLGPVSRAQVEALFGRSTVFVLPTLREPYGLALLDAMACGLACVATRVEAVPEIVADGETGLLVPAGDHVALADALAALLDQPALADELGRAGLARVQARFTWERVAERLEPCLGPPSRAAPARPEAAAG